MSTAALSTRGLDKSFGSLVVAKDIAFELPVGARYALIGPNGAGKTTLINLMTGMLPPNSGEILLGGENIATLAPEARVRSDRRAFAVGPVTPLVVRGPTPVLSWTPTRIQPASEDTMARLIDLYHHTDVELARVLEGRRDLSILARAGDATTMAPTEGRAPPQGFPSQVRAFFADAAGTAAGTVTIVS